MRPTTAPKGEILSWTLFDFANTSFYVVIITVVFPPFFEANVGDTATWGRLVSASMILTAAIGPLLGSVADVTNRKKPLLALFTIACILATVGLYLAPTTSLALVGALVIIANVGFEGGTIFYDAFLPDIASEEHYAKISGYGFAMGYLGSFVTLALILPLVTTEPVTEQNVRLTFLVAAGLFALFSLPLFLRVRERRLHRHIEENPFVEGYRRLRRTFREIRSYRDVARFLLAFFVYNDAVLTVIFFAAIFAKSELGMTTEQSIYFFMIVQATALVGSLVFGWFTNTIGARQSVLATLGLWIGIVIAAYFVRTAGEFMMIGAVAGIALGSSQSQSRTLMALLTPAEKTTEFFGFYDGFFGKASAVMGPLLFGWVASQAGLRPAMLIVGGMFLIGTALLLRVPDIRPVTGREVSV